MRQQILEAQVKDLRQIIEELFEELRTAVCFLDPDDARALQIEQTLSAMQSRTDKVMER